MSSPGDKRKPATRAIHLGRNPRKFLGAVNTPVFRATTMLFHIRNTFFTMVQTTTNRQTTNSVPKGVVGIQRWAAGAIHLNRATR